MRHDSCVWMYCRLPDDGEHNVFVPASVRAGPQDGHAPARRRRDGRETQQADREVPSQYVGLAWRPALRYAGM